MRIRCLGLLPAIMRVSVAVRRRRGARHGGSLAMVLQHLPGHGVADPAPQGEQQDHDEEQPGAHGGDD